MRFDVILTNPPFQDSVKRRRTPHKLWIDFTVAVFDRLLARGGSLLQVSPSSFSSPSNVVLQLMQENKTALLRFDNERHFPEVASTFSDYWIVKDDPDGSPTTLRRGDDSFDVTLDGSLMYLPNDLSRHSIEIHSKVMFRERVRLSVEWDYVVCHNIRRYDTKPTLVERGAPTHPYPVFHTNNITWWSSVRQDWAGDKKVMWTRSGYTKAFYDAGVHGGTDMAYFVRVATDDQGVALAANLNTTLIRYILKTAKWSGFGNERVFANLPALPLDRALTDDEAYEHFDLTDKEVDYVRESMAPRRRKDV